MTMMNLPPTDSEGDGYVEENVGGIWTPECWRKSPMQMQEEARAMNNAAFASAAANGGRHSQPPTMPWERDT